MLRFCVLLVIAAMACGAPASNKPHYDLQDAPALFDKFVKDYGKVYKDDADRAVHYQAFVSSLEKINKLNENSSATYGINKFTDYTAQEGQRMRGVHMPNSK